MVGIVVTISPSFSLYNIVVLPAASNPVVPDMVTRHSSHTLTTHQNTNFFMLIEKG